MAKLKTFKVRGSGRFPYDMQTEITDASRTVDLGTHNTTGPLGPCKHVNTHSRVAAIRDGGRYFDGACWVCPWCKDWDAAMAERERVIDE